jgi:hypothetical protein
MEVIGSIYTEVSENFQKGIIGGGYLPMCQSRKTRFRSCFNE